MTTPTWADLSYSLARHLESMAQDSHFILYVDDSQRPGFDPDLDDHDLYVQFCVHGDMVRCEVVGNRFLPQNRRHDVETLVALRSNGWSLPADERGHGSPNIFLDAPVGESDHVAWLALQVFLDVWQVEEPTRLVTDARHLRGPRPFRLRAAPVEYLTSDPIA